jgi:hypothetical protein
MTTENTNQGGQGNTGTEQGGAASNAGATGNQQTNAGNSDNSENSGANAGANSGSSDNSGVKDQEQAKPKKAFVDLYNPRNAAELTEEELEAMKTFTREQVEELARKYPNTGTGRPYLLLYDTRKDPAKQIYPRSTWTNLLGLWRMGQKTFIPWTFASRFKKGVNVKSNVAPVQDLTKEEARRELQGIKAPTQTALGAKRAVASVPVGTVQKTEAVPPTAANKAAAAGGAKRSAGLPGSSTVGNKPASKGASKAASKTISTVKKAVPPKGGSKK